MDDMAAYYPQTQPSSLHTYQYYQHPPPSSLAVVPPPPGAGPPASHHLPPQYVAYQQPMFASYGPPIPLQYSANEVRTLFIAGLPEDVKPREIYNLFREFPGYESSHLRSPTESSQVLCTFRSPDCLCDVSYVFLMLDQKKTTDKDPITLL